MRLRRPQDRQNPSDVHPSSRTVFIHALVLSAQTLPLALRLHSDLHICPQGPVTSKDPSSRIRRPRSRLVYTRLATQADRRPVRLRRGGRGPRNKKLKQSSTGSPSLSVSVPATIPPYAQGPLIGLPPPVASSSPSKTLPKAEKTSPPTAERSNVTWPVLKLVSPAVKSSLEVSTQSVVPSPKVKEKEVCKRLIPETETLKKVDTSNTVEPEENSSTQEKSLEVHRVSSVSRAQSDTGDSAFERIQNPACFRVMPKGQYRRGLLKNLIPIVPPKHLIECWSDVDLEILDSNPILSLSIAASVLDQGSTALDGSTLVIDDTEFFKAQRPLNMQGGSEGYQALPIISKAICFALYTAPKEKCNVRILYRARGLKRFRHFYIRPTLSQDLPPPTKIWVIDETAPNSYQLTVDGTRLISPTLLADMAISRFLSDVTVDAQIDKQ